MSSGARFWGAEEGRLELMSLSRIALLSLCRIAHFARLSPNRDAMRVRSLG
jgi:hypothetical protein